MAMPLVVMPTAGSDAEVRNDRVRAAAEDIRRFDVPMDDAAFVRVRERVDDVVQDAQHLSRRELRALTERALQRLSLDERHGEVEQITMRAGGVERDDMRVLELRRDLDLTAKSVTVHPGGEVRRKHLDHHIAVERALCRQKHSAHTAARQLALQLVCGA